MRWTQQYRTYTFKGWVWAVIGFGAAAFYAGVIAAVVVKLAG